MGGWRADCQLICYLWRRCEAPWDSPQASALSARCLLPLSWRAPPPPLQPSPPTPSCGFSSCLDSWGDTLAPHGSPQLPQRGTRNRWQLTSPVAQVSHPCRSHCESQPGERACATLLSPRVKTALRGHRPPPRSRPQGRATRCSPPPRSTNILPVSQTSRSLQNTKHCQGPGVRKWPSSCEPRPGDQRRVLPTHAGVTGFLDSRPFPGTADARCNSS